MNNALKIPIKPKSKNKLVFFFALLALAGVLLMIISKSNGKEQEKEVNFQSLDPAEYARNVEKQVEALCNKIDGASGAYAVVTLKGGYRAIYATDSQSGNTTFKNETVIIGSGSGAQGLLIGYENPEIAGIGIVCSGGDKVAVRKNIVAVVSSAFDIGSNKIFVSGS